MTSWENMTHLRFLFVFLSMIDLSRAGCHDYFKVENGEYEEIGNLTDIIPLIKTKDSKDIIECTLERECLNRTNVCIVLRHCFKREEDVVIKTEKCIGETFASIHLYHFMCLMANAVNHTPKDCSDYGNVCQIYSELPSAVISDQTTLSPTTAAAPTTLPETTTTVIPLSTTILPEPTTTTLRPTTSTTKDTLDPVGINSEQCSPIGHSSTKDESTETISLKILFVISIILNFALLAVCLFMCHQRRRDREQWDVVNETASNAQPMTDLKRNPPVPHENGNGVEAAHLMQPPECDSVVIKSAETATSKCPVVNGTLH